MNCIAFIIHGLSQPLPELSLSHAVHRDLLISLPDLNLQHPTLRVLFQHLQNRAKVLIRHNRVLGPHFQIVLFAAPVNLELLDLLLCLGALVLAHELGAVGRRCECGCDLLVQRFKRWLGGCVEDEKFMAVGGRDREEDWEGHCCGICSV